MALVFWYEYCEISQNSFMQNNWEQVVLEVQMEY